jgi:Fe2+ transport system protein FeoA
LQEGEQGRFVRVSDADPEMLRYLSERGISPGERLEVLERQPFGGPLTVSFAGGPTPLTIGGQLAHAMRVELDEAPSTDTGERAQSGSTASDRENGDRAARPA